MGRGQSCRPEQWLSTSVATVWWSGRPAMVRSTRVRSVWDGIAHPARIVPLAFLAAIVVGTALLSLPYVDTRARRVRRS